MKRILSILFTILCMGEFAYSQSSFLVWSDTANLVGSPSELMIGHCHVQYVGSGSSNVTVIRTHTDTANGQATYFCWQNACYAPTVNSTSLQLYMNPGDEDTTLRAYFSAGNHVGTGNATYCFYDIDNPGDSACITFTYEARTIGINEVNPLRYLSGSYPSPADNYAKINYAIVGGKDARVVITNLLGAKVKEINVTEKSGIITIPTHELTSGVYVYNFIIDGTTVGSKRLVVSHN